MTPTALYAKLLKPHLYKDTLENGLNLLVKEVPGSKVVTVQIWVKAGSVYEGEKEGGITHLIEHMIFKGTKNRGPGEVAAAIEEKGGQINAYTSFEYTVYHATLPARDWSTALEVLTDAVRNSIFDKDELEREKKVVLEEIGMRNDRPEVMFFESMMKNSYTTHPYRLPVIGTRESVSSFTRDDILHYMAKHYQPNNFTVVIVGNVRFEPVINKVKEIFDDLPSQSIEEQEVPEEPPVNGARLFSMEESVNQSQMAVVFPIPAFDDPDTPVLDVMSGILGQGDTSRLYEELRNRRGIVYAINSSAFTPKYPGLLEITATLDQKAIKEALLASLTEIFKLKYVAVDEQELERIKHSLESDFVFNLEKVEGQARVLGSFEALSGDPREDKYLEKIRAVSLDDIKRVAQKYCDSHRLIAGYLTPKGAGVKLTTEELVEISKQAEKAAKESMPSSLVSSYLGNVHRFKLDNGITLLVREEPQVPTVSAQAVFPGGLMGETVETNGAFAFISDLLPRSTERLNSRELSLAIADMAADISGFNGKNTFGLKAAFLSRFFDEGLELFRDILVTPAFDPEEAKKILPERLAAIKQQMDSLPATAFNEFNRKLFQTHPYALNSLGSEEAIKNLNAADLHKLYNRYAQPDSLVLAITGDVKAKDVFEKVNSLFGSWHKSGAALEKKAIVVPTAPPVPSLSTLVRDKEQVHLIIGFLGTTLKSPDRFALEVVDTVLSGQSGRLFTQLRDKQSLAYSLSSFNLLGLDTGSFGIYIGTSPDKEKEAVASVWQELDKIRSTPIRQDELDKAKNLILGQYDLSLQTNSAQALDLALSETYGLGLDFGTYYAKAIRQIKVEDVMRVAAKYIQPKHYVQVKVGVE
ncbi:MAG: pitrilysin family protein [Desulfobulbaceae bacterium]|nr:pitrilysin family protein [Desulfobulbaceae bacterium]